MSNLRSMCAFLSAQVVPTADDTCPECGRSGPLSAATKCEHQHRVVWHGVPLQQMEQQQLSSADDNASGSR
jgi:hypothetical protein